MKGHQQVIDALNERLSDELGAINQYFLHCEMCEDWGYSKLHAKLKYRSIQEMKHAEKLIERILYLDGMPIVSNLGGIHIGSNVEKIHKYDLEHETNTVAEYNKAVELAASLHDHGTKIILEAILREEEDHVDWIEGEMDQIAQMGLQNYLAEQIKKD